MVDHAKAQMWLKNVPQAFTDRKVKAQYGDIEHGGMFLLVLFIYLFW